MILVNGNDKYRLRWLEAVLPLRFVATKPDGNCFYHAIIATGFSDVVDVSRLRQQLYRFVKFHQTTRTVPPIHKQIVVARMTGLINDEYIELIRTDGFFAGQFEIVMMSHLLKCAIVILRHDTVIYEEGLDYLKNGTNGRICFLYFRGNNHYDLLKQRDDDNGLSARDLYKKFRALRTNRTYRR